MYLTPAIHNSAGTERVLSIKANYLVEIANYQVIIVTTDQKGRDTFFHFDERIKRYDLGLNYEDDYRKNLFIKAFNHYKKNYIYKKKLKRLFAEEQPDICVSLGGKEIEFINDLNLKCKTVFELHFSKRHIVHSISCLHPGLVWRIIAQYMNKRFVYLSKKFDTLVVLTKKDLEDWKLSNSNVVQIYNPLPYEYDEISQLTEKNIISVGRLSVQKNFEALINAWKIVNAKHPDWRMNVWGDGELRHKLERQIRNNNLDRTFLLRGKTDNIYKEYLNSSAYVMSSKYEGFPMVLLEASSCGLPLISFDCECGPSDIITNGENGFVINEGDVEGLAKAICTVIEDKQYRKKMGENSKENSYQYLQEKILPLWPTLFEKIINNNLFVHNA